MLRKSHSSFHFMVHSLLHLAPHLSSIPLYIPILLHKIQYTMKYVTKTPQTHCCSRSVRISRTLSSPARKQSDANISLVAPHCAGCPGKCPAGQVLKRYTHTYRVLHINSHQAHTANLGKKQQGCRLAKTHGVCESCNMHICPKPHPPHVCLASPGSTAHLREALKT